MPLYEIIGICRCSAPHQTAAAIKTISHSLTIAGANIRSIRILGDRIMSKQLRGNDGFNHSIGRYMSILYDGHPRAFRALQNERDQQSYEIFRFQNFRVKDFIEEAVRFTKPMEEEAPFIKNKNIKSIDYAKALKVLKEEKQKQY